MTALFKSLNDDVTSIQQKRITAEQQMQLGRAWYKSLAGGIRFYGIKKMIDYEDVWFDSIFSKPPVNTSKSFVNATLFYNAVQFFTKCFDKNAPIHKKDVKSRIHFDTNGNPDSLNSVYNVIVLSFREYFIISYLLQNSSLLKSFYPDFLFSMAGILENNFVKNPAEDLDIVMPAEIFIRLVTLFQKQLPLIYFLQMTGSHLYQQHSKKILTELQKINIDFSKISDSIIKARILEELATEIVHTLDASIRNDTPSFGMKFGLGSGSSVRGRVLLNNAFFAFQQNNSDEIQETYVTKAIGTEFVVHLLKPRNLPNKYMQIEQMIKPYIADVVKSIFKLKTRNEETRKFISYAGFLDAHNIFRKSLDDTQFFKVNETLDATGNSFITFFLIDNSCSIPSKVKTLQQVLVLLTSVIYENTKIFTKIFAYAQKGQNKAVFLTPLIEGPTRTIKNWGNLLFFNCNKVNYDPFALHEILRKNENEILAKNKIPLVFIIGDAWPVSLEKDTKQEGQKIMQAIRQKFPKMVIIYIASNAQYNPEELGYDYYITLKSDFFSIHTFTKQFQEVILKVIEENVYRRTN